MREKVLHPALWRLIRLQLRARRRRLARNLRSVKGVLFTGFTLLLFAMWLGPWIVLGFFPGGSDTSTIRAFAPLGMLALCFLNLLSAKPESGVAFSPSEIDFLFPGPFTRRQLLLYRICGLALNAVIVAAFVSLLLMRQTALYPAAYLGAFLGFYFIYMFQIVVALIASTVAEQAFTRGRRLVLITIAASLAFGLSWAVMSAGGEGTVATVDRFRGSWIGICLLAPFDVFGRTLAAQTLVELAGWASLGLAINLAMILLILRMDTNFLEASMFASQRLYERLQRARRGGVFVVSKPVGRLRALPRFPWLWGAGPIAWRQSATAIRSARGFVTVVVIVGVAMAVPIGMTSGFAQPNSVGGISALAVMSLMLLPQFLRFDFRGDIDQIEILKTLPLSFAAVSAGQLITPVSIAIIVQAILLAVMSMLSDGASPELYIALAFLPPVNLLVFGLENLLFLLYPYRMATPGGADLLTMGRQMLSAIAKMIVLLFVAGIAAGTGGLAYLISGNSISIFVAVSWLMTCLLAAAVVPAVGFAYRRFDPSLDAPE